jgi:hypothetical protein
MLAILLSALMAATAAVAQSTGTISLSVTGSGCIILGQVASLGNPLVITKSVPICGGSKESIGWPLTDAGDGAASSLAIYSQISGKTPGCVLSLSQMQAMYLLGRDLEWRMDVNQMYDNTQGGFIVDPTSFEPVTW